MITQDELKRWLRYCPVSGNFYWLDCTSQSISIGDTAGSNHLGYIRIGLKNVNYLAHRLAWFYMTGTWPDLIDHIDGNRNNNRWDNLRLGSASLNGLNLQKPLNNTTSNYLGVSWHKTRRTWIAHIKYRGRQYHLGCFSSKEEAAKAVSKKRAEFIIQEETNYCNTKRP